MKQKLSFIVKLGVLVLAFWGICCKSVQAKDNAPTQQDRSFTVKAILPKNQVTDKETFFDLQVKPNQKQKLSMIVMNIGKKPMTIKINLNNAYTSSNGIISYDRSKVKLYQPLQPSLTDLIIGKRTATVKVQPQETKIVSFPYKAPAEPFKGIILGGIVATSAVGSSTKSNFAIQNQIQYVTGIVLRSNMDHVQPDLKMSKEVTGKSRSTQQGIGFTLYNPAPINVSGMKMNAHFIRNKKQHIKKTMSSLQVAPNSKWQVMIPFKKVKPGSYKLNLTLTAKNGYKKSFVRHFTISKAQTAILHKKTTPKRYNRVLPWIFVGFFLVIILGLVYLLWIYLKARNNRGR
ncbi:DUF916 and DUF3324 domain-containing protein [Bombilactobacillus folatiphilus]|uniref:DUF916 and DUF3324 domain-containing protein n=1 Tax=Bombilactobacillus folatiphilus TaxID=2923362 RepID=A0ABY4P894_9LACO|nr:DUF916 domain-containing protein [Bombilactobacillus folatiphilus]UQS81857.1 DUF916 and DUF3324 domain-containing protein [Bombilactobacillus folatiphilus]